MLDGKSPPPASKDSGISAADSVARDLADMILTQMVPGSSLPSEAELATRYGVSRLTVREAVKLLAGRGLR
jgi:GntR family transcriptional repressor for pyruvate dehydrogenase complex